MKMVSLTPEKRREYIALARSMKDVKKALKLRVILALDAGYTEKAVAELFLIDEDTVTRWKKKYEKRQFFTDWLGEEYKGYDGKLTKDEEKEIDKYVAKEIITDCKQVIEQIKKRFGKEYSVDGVTKLLHRLEFVYKGVIGTPGKLDERKQRLFLQEYEKMEEDKKDDEVILFGDGVHPTHNMHKTRAWVKKGKEKQIKTNTGRGRVNINGVLDVEKLEVTIHISKTLNAKETIAFFDEIQEKYKDKKNIIIIVDNAPYYKNKEVTAYLSKSDCRIELKFLPSYSPNLNFIERLWKFMKKYIIGVKYREKLKDFEFDIKQFFEHIDQYEKQLRPFIGTKLHLIKVTA